ncbi:MAG: hypothetical protein ACI9XO_000557 [Paraglaciecola sp.]
MDQIYLMTSIFNRFFKPAETPDGQPNIKFGRYSDSYKNAKQYNAWDKALVAFEKERYLDCYRAFFKYLRDEKEDNLKFWEANHGIHFELLQGSKKVVGFADRKQFKAEAKVVKVERLDLKLMKRLSTANFDLKYSRYALDNEQDITILFDTYTLDGSPYKLYYALKELATNADKQDDLLVEEFEKIHPADTDHLQPLADLEKEVKYTFIKKQIEYVLTEVNHGELKPNEYPGAIAYLFLDLTYKLDYLTKPEGFMMESLERIHRLYFTNNKEDTHNKNEILKKEFEALFSRTKDDYFREMYEVPATFGITSPVNHDKIASFIDAELHNMDWYQEQGHEQIALAIPSYIVGYSLFYYAVPKPAQSLFHLYFQIIENDYFQSLGYPTEYYHNATQKFNTKNIKCAIKNIVTENRYKYLRLSPDLGQLNFSSLPAFAKSFLMMVRDLDMAKID